MNNPICPTTGGQLAREVRPMTITFKGESLTFGMPGWYGEPGAESIHTGADMAVSDRALHRLQARVAGLLEPEDIRRIRKKLRLTQEQAGQLIGGGPRAFQKYEIGDVLPSQAISSALTLLERDPTGLDVLKARQCRNRQRQGAMPIAASAPA